MCLRALPAALQVDSFLLFNLPVGKAKETGERGRGAGSGELGGPALPRLAPGPSLRRSLSRGDMAPCRGQHLGSANAGGACGTLHPSEPTARGAQGKSALTPSLSQQPAQAERGI